MKWVENPPDNSRLEIDILPASFTAEGSFCVECGGATDLEWICIRCGADHWPAVRRQRKANSS
jgi:hypothetical protein